MPRLSAIISYRNVLRAIGIGGLCYGVPMLVAPALSVSLFFKDRTNWPKEDKSTMDSLMRANGIGNVSVALYKLFLPPSLPAMYVTLAEYIGWLLYSAGYRLSGKWKDNECRLSSNSVTIAYTLMGCGLTAASIGVGSMRTDEE